MIDFDLSLIEKIDRSKYTESQLIEIDTLISSVRQKLAKVTKIATRKTRQQRADEDRRARLLGQKLQALSEHDRRAKGMLETLLNDLDEKHHYLFPSRWPAATRIPASRPQKRSPAPEGQK